MPPLTSDPLSGGVTSRSPDATEAFVDRRIGIHEEDKTFSKSDPLVEGVSMLQRLTLCPRRPVAGTAACVRCPCNGPLGISW